MTCFDGLRCGLPHVHAWAKAAMELLGLPVGTREKSGSGYRGRGEARGIERRFTWHPQKVLTESVGPDRAGWRGRRGHDDE